MATRPGPWCWWLYLWVSLQGRLGRFVGEGRPSNSNYRSPSGSFTEGNYRTGKGMEILLQAVYQLEGSLPSPYPLPTGYFLADGADMLWNQSLGQAWEVLCHHLMVRLRERGDRKECVPISHQLSVL